MSNSEVFITPDPTKLIAINHKFPFGESILIYDNESNIYAVCRNLAQLLDYENSFNLCRILNTTDYKLISEAFLKQIQDLESFLGEINPKGMIILNLSGIETAIYKSSKPDADLYNINKLEIDVLHNLNKRKGRNFIKIPSPKRRANIPSKIANNYSLVPNEMLDQIFSVLKDANAILENINKKASCITAKEIKPEQVIIKNKSHKIKVDKSNDIGEESYTLYEACRLLNKLCNMPKNNIKFHGINLAKVLNDHGYYHKAHGRPNIAFDEYVKDGFFIIKTYMFRKKEKTSSTLITSKGIDLIRKITKDGELLT